MGYPAAVGLLWNVSDRLAVRPETNWSRASVDTTSSFNAIGFPLNDAFTTSGSGWVVGVGASALLYLVKGDALRTYVSPRFTYARSTTTVESPVVPILGTAPTRATTTTTPSYGASGSVGAQYSFAKRFGVFGEVGVGYTRTTSSSSPSNISQTETTSTSIGLRSGVGVILFFGS